MIANTNRFTSDPGARAVRCSNCTHRHGGLSCDAYPLNIPKSFMERLTSMDFDTPCSGDVYYSPKDGVWLKTGKEYYNVGD